MRFAVIGGGVTGLVAARHLVHAGHACDVYERWPGLGGQAATVDVGGGHRLERYYHHWFTSDRAIVELCEELGLGDQVEWHPSSVAFFVDGAMHPFNGPLDLLRFRPLKMVDRIRMGLAVLALQRRYGDDFTQFEHQTAREWIEQQMGRPAYERVWGPLLRGKFGDRAGDISMAWLWGKLTMRRQIRGEQARREMLGYPALSFEPFFEALRDDIVRHHGSVLIDRPAVSIERDEDGVRLCVAAGAPGSFRRGHDPRRFDVEGSSLAYDGVLATVPTGVFARLLSAGLRAEVGDDYLDGAASIEYHTAICVLLEINRRFSPYYWTNIGDATMPFVGLVEHTNLVSPDRYGGRRFLYVANYVAPGDPLLELSDEELLDHYLPALQRVSPEFSRNWINSSWTFREPAAQPIVDVGYHERIPALGTPAHGLVLANTTQIYPQDRGTNYAVALAGDAAATLLGGLA